MKKLSFFNRILFLVNNLAAFILLLSYLAWFVNPSTIPLVGIVSLGVPMLLLINLFFIFYWLLLRKKQFLLSLLCIGLGWWHIQSFLQFNHVAPSNTKNGIRIMTYNVRVFHYPGAGKWHNTPPAMAAMTDSLKPDILCMQEYLPNGNWVPKFSHPYKYIANKQSATLAIYSNYKIINTGEVAYSNQQNYYNKFIYADVIIEEDTIRIINVHLASIHLNNQDLKTFTTLDDASEEQVKSSGKNIYTRLLASFKTRGTQINEVITFIEKSPYPTILCGDFNDTPTSYAYKKASTVLNDCFQAKGFGFGTTHTRFKAYNFPMRIDHILTSKEFEINRWQVVPVVLSDHFPIYTDVVLP